MKLLVNDHKNHKSAIKQYAYNVFNWFNDYLMTIVHQVLFNLSTLKFEGKALKKNKSICTINIISLSIVQWPKNISDLMNHLPLRRLSGVIGDKTNRKLIHWVEPIYFWRGNHRSSFASFLSADGFDRLDFFRLMNKFTHFMDIQYSMEMDRKEILNMLVIENFYSKWSVSIIWWLLILMNDRRKEYCG